MMHDCHYCGNTVNAPVPPLCPCPKCGREFWESRREPGVDDLQVRAVEADKHDSIEQGHKCAGKICRVPGCSKPRKGGARGACCACYSYARRHPDTPRACKIVKFLLDTDMPMPDWERTARAKPEKQYA